MENATKVLVIAGSILVTIILISTGILLYKSSSGTFKSADDVSKSIGQKTGEVIFEATATDQEKFNAPLLKYFGNSVSGKDVKGFLNTVIQTNASNPNQKVLIMCWFYNANGESKKDSSGHGGAASKIQKIRDNKINDDKTYQIKIAPICDVTKGNGYKNGYVKCVRIIENK